MTDIITVNNLSFAYEKGKNVLEKIGLSIEGNTINAILGANGSGKSTLLDCLTGINEVSNGEILIKEKKISNYGAKELAKQVAYISQSTIINIDYSVREFILFGRSPHLKLGETPSNDDYKKCNFYADILGIPNLLDRKITKVSGGERQLCFICRALVQESDILIFDEPLSSLDFGNQNKLLILFSRLQKQGKTIVFTTHNPNQILDLNCNVIILNDKHIIAHGKASEIITKNLLETVYNSKVDIANNHYTFSE